MQSKATTPLEYLDSLTDERREVIERLREEITENLPQGFNEQMSYGMLSYVVPHSEYPDGYHCDPRQPLPFMSLASQKNFVAVYHMGIYADPALMNWFKQEYAKRIKTKLDMGKSCIRFKNMKTIPYDLIGELSAKMTAKDWIKTYEEKLKR